MTHPNTQPQSDEPAAPLPGPGIRMPTRPVRPDVMTPVVTAAINTIFDAHQDGGFACVSGRAGTGKTTMAKLLMGQLAQWYDPSDPATFAAVSYEVGKVDGRDRVAMKRMCLSVHKEVAGELDEGYLRRAEDKDIAKDVVRECKLRGVELIIIDEAGGLSVDAIRGLMLIGNTARREGHILQFVLIGMDDLPTKLHKLPQIKRRVHAWVFFHSYEPQDTWAFLRAVHPHFERLDQANPAHAAQVEFVHHISAGLPGLMVPFLNQVDRQMGPLGYREITLPLLRVVHRLRSDDEIAAVDASGFGSPGSSGKSRVATPGGRAGGGKAASGGGRTAGARGRRAAPEVVDDAARGGDAGEPPRGVAA